MEIKEYKNYFMVDGLKIHWDFKLLSGGFEAITLFGHVFDRQNKQDLRNYLDTYWGKVMVNHERIHILQAKSFKLRYFTFYIVYLWFWIKGLFKYGAKGNRSYYNIPFEREAYKNETDFSYKQTYWKKYT